MGNDLTKDDIDFIIGLRIEIPHNKQMDNIVAKLPQLFDDAEKWNELSDPMSNRSLEVIKNLSGEAGKNFKIVEGLKKGIEELEKEAVEVGLEPDERIVLFQLQKIMDVL